MKPTLFLLSLLACLFSVMRPVRADSIALNFGRASDLPTTVASATTFDSPRSETSPQGATDFPPATVSKGDVDLSTSISEAAQFAAPSTAISFALPQEETTIAQSQEVAPSASDPVPELESQSAPAPTMKREDPEIANNSEKSAEELTATQPLLAEKPGAAVVHPEEQAVLFEGGSNSLVARTVGAAEGNLTTDGHKTDNYYGHVDPGNGVWNRGTFSYQFGNTENLSPQEADARQLAKIKGHYENAILPKARQLGLELSLEEALNAIDLANQAPLAVTESAGFVERLAEAKREKGLSGETAILEGRVWAFWNPDKNNWDAPGLRAYDDISKQESIRRDQERRMLAIADALANYQQAAQK